VEIEIYSDVVCPWCYIGKRRLEQALEDFPIEVTLRWRAYQLDPSAPHTCAPLIDWLGARYGGPDRARQMFGHATAAGAGEGLDFDFDKALIANTFDAHRLIAWAGSAEAVVFGATADTQAHLVEALHRAHFTDGLDIGSYDVLASLAAGVGLDADRVRRLLDSTEGVAETRAELDATRELGVTSVPTFVFAGKYAVSGAQDPATLRSVLDEVARREGVAPVLRTLTPAGSVPSAGTATPAGTVASIPSPRRPADDLACDDDSCGV
jgi:predicted DsbA family dithiol-disulfide isomerase